MFDYFSTEKDVSYYRKQSLMWKRNYINTETGSFIKFPCEFRIKINQLDFIMFIKFVFNVHFGKIYGILHDFIRLKYIYFCKNYTNIGFINKIREISVLICT